jgi:ATP-dependent Clp protease ATP-binding subunit ClpA
LGLLKPPDSVALRTLGSFGVTLEEARLRVAEIIGLGEEPATSHIPLTPRTKKVLEFSLQECRRLSQRTIGPEHILLGLVHEGEGVGAQILQTFGANEATVRERVGAILSQDPDMLVGDAAELEEQPNLANVEEPRCPWCRADLETSLAYRTLQAEGDQGTKDLLIVFCNRCGRAWGTL